jgi:L-alanine-DL-glutamate epimerase-like enolase superfamily enzyme
MALREAPTVVSAKAWSIALPLVKPYAVAYGTLTHTTNVIVRLTADDGTVGWGEGKSTRTARFIHAARSLQPMPLKLLNFFYTALQDP